MDHLSEMVKKHETAKMHMDSCLKLAAFGTVNIATQLDDSYRIAVRRHNDEVSKNRHILGRLIDCVKFCGLFELALRGKDESEGSSHAGIFRGLVDLVANHAVQERFFEFIPILNATADSIASVILERLNSLVTDDDKGKLIAQAYDGASVMRGERAGVQQKVCEHYENARYVHCYAHQMNLIMQQATSQIPAVRVFFSDLSGITSFFTRSPKRTTILDQIVARRLPRASSTRWNFKSRIVNTVYENLDDLIECFRSIVTASSFDSTTVREASGFLRMLKDEDFQFFLQLFHQIMPHMDMMYQQLQKKDIDAVFIKQALQNFTMKVQSIRDQRSFQEQQQEATGTISRRALGEEEKQRLSKK
ncbi:Zinc finger MYM-type protein 1 [Anabarilius grahami]|uniref:Zinc finger MYM-type protein 1 n=1 Tax=Anabarilius grahami TaxID=495550 RepID=A0A3N0YUV0_ANAGA|nr:Zinc finger MYM-type protein 1 [Anabarilius grahami]